MSFLDERDKPPRDPAGAGPEPERPTTTGGGPPPRRRGPRGPGTDRGTVVRRRITTLVGFVVVLLLVGLLIRGCLDARQERAYEDYAQEVSSLVAESGQESEALFELLQEPGDIDQVELQNTMNGLAIDAERLVERAETVEAPDELMDTHGVLVQVLDLRRDGLSGIADELPAAFGDEQEEEATEAVARQMRRFLASDVVYEEEVRPPIESELASQGLSAQVEEVPESQFLPDIEWLQPDTVREALGQVQTSEDERASPGLHGTGLAGVTAQPSGQALAEGTTTEVPLSEDLAFDVAVQNQGENDEEDVTVTLALTGGAEPIETEGRIDAIAAGATETVTLTPEDAPPTGEELEAAVEIEPVPGEEVTDNNEAVYGVTFVE